MQHRTATRRRYLNLVAGCGLASFTVNALAMVLFMQMAVHVAHGGRLHIGADILFSGLSSGQLAIMSCSAGAIGLVSVVAALVANIMAEG